MCKEIICKICGDAKKSNATFVGHFNKCHVNELSLIEYCIKYSIFDRIECIICGDIARFVNFGTGFKMTCTNQICQNTYKHQETQKALLKKYGVTNPSQLPNHIEKVKATNLMKYGTETYNNPEKYKETILLRYGVDNPTQIPGVMEKRRLTSLERYGTEYPIQSQLVKDKIEKTNLERYGVSCPFSVPEIHQKGQENIIARHGGIGFGSPVTSEKIIETMIDMYGTQYAQQNGEIRTRTNETNIERYGTKSTLNNPQIMLERHGVSSTSHSPEIVEKQKVNRKKNLLKKYGVENVSQLSWVQDIIKFNNVLKYGVTNTTKLPITRQKMAQTLFEKYGVYNPMHSEELRTRQLDSVMSSDAFTPKKYTKSDGTAVYYQSTPEFNYIQECENNNIFIQNGPVIPYILNNKKSYYHVDFYIRMDTGEEFLIEIKKNHVWWIADVESGKASAKEQAAIAWCIENKLAGFKILFDC